MTFISYAQNFEDVMLWRALKHIENGFYIDVGAWSPDIDSVTRAFYERGWRGINVEPNPDAHTQLLARRTRDINLRIAIGEKPGTQTMSIVADTGLSTLDETIAQKHASAGWIVEKQEVEVTTLTALWEEHVPEGQEVHILKVDVEGLEEAVIRGNNWSKYRPWIVVVEATLPMSQQESHEAWEPLLLNANYRFAYADGLNRFYVANEHAELLPAFKYPPNVFDDFKLNVRQQAETRAQQATTALMTEQEHTMWLESELNTTKERIEELAAENARARDQAAGFEAELIEKSQVLNSTMQALNKEQKRAHRLENELNAAKTKTDELNSEVHHWWTVADDVSHELRAMQTSYCWRITRPLRNAFDILLWIKARDAGALKTFKHGMKRALSSILACLARFVLARPRLKTRALTLLHRIPALETRLYRFVVGGGIIAGGTTMQTTSDMPDKAMAELSDLPPSARRTYTELKVAIERNHRRGY